MQFICSCNRDIIEQTRLRCVRSIQMYFEKLNYNLIDFVSSNPIKPSVTPKRFTYN